MTYLKCKYAHVYINVNEVCECVSMQNVKVCIHVYGYISVLSIAQVRVCIVCAKVYEHLCV